MAYTGKLVLIIGPSGVGKSVLLKRLKASHAHVHFPRSATTRLRREGEGDDLYHFVSDEEFDALIEQNKVLEWAVVHGGARYGTLAEEIIPFIEQGQIVIREVDVQGYESIAQHKFFRGDSAPYHLQTIFILPDNKEQLVLRITARAPIAEDELERRVASMEKELTYAQRCDASVINKEGKIEETLKAIETLIFDQ